MLTHLQIRDFAIIDAVELELRPGLTVLTGETGAGKSILVDALQLLAGGRAGARGRAPRRRARRGGRHLRSVARTARAASSGSRSSRSSVGGELLVRRVVGADGRSRAYLNGQAVPCSCCARPAASCIDIHGQHEFQSLTRSAAQRELLDGYAGLERTRQPGAASPTACGSSCSTARSTWRPARATATRSSNCCATRRRSSPRCSSSPGSSSALTEEHARLANRGRLAEGGPGRARAAVRGRGRERPRAPSPRAQPRCAGAGRARCEARRRCCRCSRRPDPGARGGARAAALPRDASTSTRRARSRSSGGWRRSRNWRASTASRPVELPGARRAAAARARRARARRARTWRSCARSSRRRCSTTATQALELSGKRRPPRAPSPATSAPACRRSAWPAAASRSDVTQDGNAEPAQHGIDQIEFRVSANPGSAAARARQGGLRRRAVASVTGGAGVLRRRRRRAAWCSTRSTRASAARSRRSSAASCARSARAARCCA